MVEGVVGYVYTLDGVQGVSESMDEDRIPGWLIDMFMPRFVSPLDIQGESLPVSVIKSDGEGIEFTYTITITEG